MGEGDEKKQGGMRSEGKGEDDTQEVGVWEVGE